LAKSIKNIAIFLPFPEANLWQTGKFCKNSPEWLWNGFALIKGEGLNQSKTLKRTIIVAIP